MNIDKVYEELLEELPQTTIYKNEPMSKHTSFKIGGNADIYIKVKSVEEIVKIKEYAKKNGIPVTVIGNGSNILVRDSGIRGITIQMNMQDIKIENVENDVFVYAASGVKLAALAITLQKEGITGFEFAGGIPGTIGGAVRMNAGAYGGEFSNIVEEVTYLDEENNIVTVPKEKVEFSYRHSIFVNSILLRPRRPRRIIKFFFEGKEQRIIVKPPGIRIAKSRKSGIFLKVRVRFFQNVYARFKQSPVIHSLAAIFL